MDKEAKKFTDARRKETAKWHLAVSTLPNYLRAVISFVKFVARGHNKKYQVQRKHTISVFNEKV